MILPLLLPTLGRQSQNILELCKDGLDRAFPFRALLLRGVLKIGGRFGLRTTYS